MAQIVIATQDEDLRERLSTPLLEGGHSVAFVSTWARLVQTVAQGSTRLVLLDASSTALTRGGRAGTLLASLVESLTPRPQLRTVCGDLPPLESLAESGQALPRLARRLAGPAVPRDELALLQLLGVGPRPLQALAKLARSPFPVCLQGERGSGKLHVAQAIQRLGGGGSFITLKTPGSRTTLGGSEGVSLQARGTSAPGTLYLPLHDGWTPEHVLDVRDRASEQGWHVVAGTRRPLAPGFGDWAHLRLRPLRERSDDLHRLTLHYVNQHRKVLGLPRRRLGKATWALVHGYAWPRNARELETFVVTMLSSVDRSLILPRHLPPTVRAMVDPTADAAAIGAAAVFEDLVDVPIRRVVDLYERGGDLTLHRLVMDGAERPLLRATLARTGGNRKAAAELLGMSRNTLKAHVERLLEGKPAAEG